MQQEGCFALCCGWSSKDPTVLPLEKARQKGEYRINDALEKYTSKGTASTGVTQKGQYSPLPNIDEHVKLYEMEPYSHIQAIGRMLQLEVEIEYVKSTNYSLEKWLHQKQSRFRQLTQEIRMDLEELISDYHEKQHCLDNYEATLINSPVRRRRGLQLIRPI